jgi:hypothetical protein
VLDYSAVSWTYAACVSAETALVRDFGLRNT